MNCINLRERFGERYRVAYEESYYAQYGERARVVDPWLMIIPCEHGHFYPHGGELLAFASDKNGSIANKLRKLDFATTHQDGDDGVNVVFPAERFVEVAKIVKPKSKRPPMSEERRRQCAERLRKYQPPKGQRVQDLVENRPNSALESPPTPAPDSELMSGIRGPKWPA